MKIMTKWIIGGVGGTVLLATVLFLTRKKWLPLFTKKADEDKTKPDTKPDTKKQLTKEEVGEIIKKLRAITNALKKEQSKESREKRKALFNTLLKQASDAGYGDLGKKYRISTPETTEEMSTRKEAYNICRELNYIKKTTAPRTESETAKIKELEKKIRELGWEPFETESGWSMYKTKK